LRVNQWLARILIDFKVAQSFGEPQVTLAVFVTAKISLARDRQGRKWDLLRATCKVVMISSKPNSRGPALGPIVCAAISSVPVRVAPVASGCTPALLDSLR
jgi:hypothetical protein